LILDELEIQRLTPDDKKFLEEFTNLELLAMNSTKLKSTANLPDAPALVRVRQLRIMSRYTLYFQSPD
jgi:hypothetical protein